MTTSAPTQSLAQKVASFLQSLITLLQHDGSAVNSLAGAVGPIVSAVDPSAAPVVAGVEAGLPLAENAAEGAAQVGEDIANGFQAR